MTDLERQIAAVEAAREAAERDLIETWAALERLKRRLLNVSGTFEIDSTTVMV